MDNGFSVEFIRGSIYNGDDYEDILMEGDIEKIPNENWMVSLDIDDKTTFLFKVNDIVQYPNKNLHKIFGDVVRVIEKT